MITVSVQNRNVLDALQALQGRMDDLTPVMQDIGALLESSIHGRFEAQRDPSGNPWAAWSPSYDPARGGSRPTDGNTTVLDLYGHMLDSLSWKADKSSVTAGFAEPYAAYHEWGTKQMPRRGMLFADPEAGHLGEEDAQGILEIVARYLLGRPE